MTSADTRRVCPCSLMTVAEQGLLATLIWFVCNTATGVVGVSLASVRQRGIEDKVGQARRSRSCLLRSRMFMIVCLTVA